MVPPTSRNRLVDPNRRLCVIRNEKDFQDFCTDRDLAYDTLDYAKVLRHTIDSSPPPPPASPKTLSRSHNRKGVRRHGQAASTAAVTEVVDKKQRTIVTPLALEVGPVVSRVKFAHSNHYLRYPTFKDCTSGLVLIDGRTIDFNMLMEDRDFLASLNDQEPRTSDASMNTTRIDESRCMDDNGAPTDKAKVKIATDDFCVLIDTFEKLTQRGDPISITQAMQATTSALSKPVNPDIIKCIYHHWIARRKAIQKPLLRIYHPPPQLQ
eukprot:GHVO01016979.1.p1 GENE.GHVO01016979.1~~GHVO01016979.1.p1  ORF type:complete len:266 (+),score=59.21 GHVO01016979.1:553-1350(+)